MTEILPENYYAGMWFVNLPNDMSKFGKGADIHALLFQRPGEPNRWYLDFRTRHYRGPEIFDHNDEKNWMHKSGTFESEEKAIEGIEKVFRTMSTCLGPSNVVDFFPLHCKGEEAMQKILSHPPKWLHTKQVTEAEAVQKGYI